MSVAELTINYVAVPEFNVSLRKRKAIFAILSLFFTVLISLYLYLSAEIVAFSFRDKDLQEKINYALIISSERESELVKSIYGKNSDFFAAQGYEKPLSIEVIRRSLNVVEISQSRQLY